MKTAWFTICAHNYLGYAKTLHQSLLKNHPDAHFILILVDEPDKNSLPPYTPDETLPYKVILAKDLEIAAFNDMSWRYNVMELATAIKPSSFKYIFDQLGFEQAIYLDPDIYITAPLNKPLNALQSGADLVLTPHILTPYPDNAHPDDQQILNAGSYNLGFAAFAKNLKTQNFLQWWHQKLLKTGHNDLSKGQFVDQKYMDLAPSFLEKAYLLRDPGYNAAYWNLHERPITRNNNGWHANKELLAFFHFSGVIPGRPDIFSKHQNRYSVKDIGHLQVLLIEYLDALETNQQGVYKTIPYGYDFFANGEKFTGLMRSFYAHLNIENNSPPSKDVPSKTPFNPEFFQHFDDDYSLPTLFVMAWKSRPDLQKAFPIDRQDGRNGFLNWIEANASTAFDWPSQLVPALLNANQSSATSKHHGARNLSPKVILAKGASHIINASPNLRPLYKNIPIPIRSAIKTALYRTHSNLRGSQKAALMLNLATGDFSPSRNVGVALYGYVRSQSGIGQGARGLVSAIKSQNIPLGVCALENPGDPREAYPFPEIALPKRGYRTSLINANAEQILKLEELLNPRHLDGVYKIAYWVWELPIFPEAFRPAIERIDEIWVPSQFVADGLKKVTQKPVHVLPYPVVPQNPAALGRSHFALPEHKTVFLTAFDIHSFLKRKNPASVIEAFVNSFDPSSPNAPVLAIKVHGNKGNSEARAVLEKHIGGAQNIIIIDQTLKRDEYIALHHLADVFVSLHRAEGFGLNIAEAMLIGKPVIATGFSGNMDYMTPENSIPIGFEMVDVPDGAYPHAQGQQWAEANQKEVILAMQRLAYDQHERARIGKKARAQITQRYSLVTTGRNMHQRLSAIDPNFIEKS